jgi:cellulose synthase/poly-beta-1,6-N-acetylglucosamine synthase-like glycosyltransferase
MFVTICIISLFLNSTFLIYLLMGFRHNVVRRMAGGIPSVSILVAVRDGARTIGSCLESLLDQDYPHDRFEIIVIDDCSTDDTPRIICNIATKNRFVKYIRNEQPQKWRSTKKAALSAGVEIATGEILLFTDADCFPPKTWVTNVVLQFGRRTGLIAGFSPQCAGGKKMWNDFLLIDSLAAAVVAAGSIGWGTGITCTGRNLACRKVTLRDIGGYDAFPDTVSGDDDFLLQLVSRKGAWEVKYTFHHATHVPAAGPADLFEFIKQKRRHISAGRSYRPLHMIGYSLYHLSNLLIWLFALVGFWLSPLYLLPLSIKLLIDGYVLKQMADELDISCNTGAFFIWELLLPIYHIIAGPCALFGKINWNSR